MPKLAGTMLLTVSLCVTGCNSPDAEQAWENPVLRMAVTTSTRDTGLLDELLPAFEAKHGIRVDVLANGTGKAIKLGEGGDVDVVLVHARELEDAFMEAGFGTRREDVMYNTFELLGPESDPAGMRNQEASDGLQAIAASGERFVSRGDQSGTHQRELKLWQAGGGLKAWDGHIESGQGMGPTLIMADEMQGYTLADRGTYLAMRDKISLVPLAAQSETLHNPYGIMVVNPARHEGVNAELADALVDYMISRPAQQAILDFRIRGEPLFHPLHIDLQ